MLVPLGLALTLVNFAVCFNQIGTPQPLLINQNSYANSLAQPSPINQNRYVNALPQLQQLNNQNGYTTALSEQAPINQNAFVKGLIKPPSTNQNGFISGLSKSFLANPNGYNSLPVNQNGLISSLLQNQPINQNDYPLQNLPINENVSPLQNLPVNENSYPLQNPPINGCNRGSVNCNPFQNQPINQNGLLLQTPPNNKNAYINPQLNLQQKPQFQYGIVNPTNNLPINQNGYIKQFKNLQLNQNEYVNQYQNGFVNFGPEPPRVNSARSKLRVAFQWRYLDWIHPTVQLTGKNFTVGKPLSQDVDIDRRGRIFVTTPQWLQGTPITLSMITDLKSEGGPLLTPYPDWTWHKPDCDGLVSVYRIAIDECNRLWAVDTGHVGRQSVCPTKIVMFDLNTDTLQLKYIIPEDQTAGRTASYVCPIVDVGETCQDTYLYVADVLRHGLLVFSLRENRSWRLDNTPGNAFGYDQEATNLTIVGETFDLTDGVLGMSLSPRGLFSKRSLYFNALASYYEKFTDVDSLKRSFVYQPIVYQSEAKRSSQAGAQASSRTGAIFFQLAEYTALACWNIERPFTPENIVVLARDDVELQYISGIKVIQNMQGEEELWFNTNRLQKTIKNTRRIDEINFRFIRGKVEDLIRGTRCEPTGRTAGQPNLLGWKRI